MKLCIFGAGAIGGHLGAMLGLAGNDVSLIARGPHLAAMRSNGLRLIDPDGDERTVDVAASDRPEDFGPQDYVFLSTKAYAAPDAVEAMQPLLGPDTCVVTATNGMPWWYFHKLPGPWEGRRIPTVDPGDVQWDGIGPDRVLGTVLWASAQMPEPGVVRHTFGNRMPLGEPGGERSERVTILAKILSGAGLKAPVRDDIRSEIWLKLWGNLAFNPVSVLTEGTLEDMATDGGTRPVIRQMMTEARAVAEILGIKFPVDVDARIKMAADVGPHPTSTLQDLKAGKPLELDALLGAVVDVAKMVGVATPTLEMIFGLAVLRARQAGCYPGKA
jgi:2-dehydropantoate 2-reductase